MRVHQVFLDRDRRGRTRARGIRCPEGPGREGPEEHSPARQGQEVRGENQEGTEITRVAMDGKRQGADPGWVDQAHRAMAEGTQEVTQVTQETHVGVPGGPVATEEAREEGPEEILVVDRQALEEQAAEEARQEVDHQALGETEEARQEEARQVMVEQETETAHQEEARQGEARQEEVPQGGITPLPEGRVNNLILTTLCW